MRFPLVVSMVAAAGLAAGLATARAIRVPSAEAADHREAPGVAVCGALDLNDLYAFRDPADPGQLILAMTVNPFTAPPQNGNSVFDTTGVYRFEVDRNDDLVPDLTFDVRFGPKQPDNRQTIAVNGVSTDVGGNPMMTTPPSIAAAPPSPAAFDFDLGGFRHTIFCGQREDPFFFDSVGFNRFLRTGMNFPRPAPAPDGFAGFNISAIVIRTPVAFLQGGVTTGTRFNLVAVTLK